MTGPEHYEEGQRLLAGRPVSDDEISRGIAPGVWPPGHMDVLAAQAHFTAALVACLAAHQHPEGMAWAKVIDQ